MHVLNTLSISYVWTAEPDRLIRSNRTKTKNIPFPAAQHYLASFIRSWFICTSFLTLGLTLHSRKTSNSIPAEYKSRWTNVTFPTARTLVLLINLRPFTPTPTPDTNPIHLVRRWLVWRQVRDVGWSVESVDMHAGTVPRVLSWYLKVGGIFRG